MILPSDSVAFVNPADPLGTAFTTVLLKKLMQSAMCARSLDKPRGVYLGICVDTI